MANCAAWQHNRHRCSPPPSRPPFRCWDGVAVPAFVLQRFLDGEREAVDAACSAVAEHLGVLLGGGGDEATTGAAASSFLNKVAAGGGR